MNLIRVVSVAVLLAQVGLGSANAQALRNADQPAEFPPLSYKGSQYVDSRGCVYIRAGIDGNVTWVPRVSRSRQQVCGAKPTLAGKASGPVAKPVTQRAEAKPVQIVPDEPLNASPKSARAQVQVAPEPRQAAAPKPRRVASTKPAPVQVAPQRRTQPTVRAQRPMQTIASAPAPRRTIAAPAPVQYGATAVAPRATAQRRVALPARKTASVRNVPARNTVTRQVARCAGASAISSQYLRGDGVRCGPQAVSPLGDYVNTSANRSNSYVASAPQAQQQMPRQIRLTNTTRIAPRHVVHAQAQAADVGQVPNGYRRVWDDDRLNPKRAHQTLAGKQAMELRWTRDLPRRLIDIRTRQDVTAFYPDLVYPYTDLEEQRLEQSQYTSQQLPQPRRSTGYLSTKGKAPKATVSTRSAPKAPRAKPSARAVRVGVSHRFVHVGTYASEAAARGDAARLRAAGLKVQMGTLRSGSKALLAGPYGSTQMLGNALYAARQAGFPDAYTRK